MWMCTSCLKGNVPLTPGQKQKLSRHKGKLRSLANKKYPIAKKKALLLQKGGFVLTILKPLVTGIASLLLKWNIEYSQKMVLVPQDIYDAMKSDNVITAHKTDLKGTNKKHAILEDPKLPPDHKIKLYNQELQKAIDNRQKVKQEFMIELQ